jgi:membrane protease YdiL (CAAX protease family)
MTLGGRYLIGFERVRHNAGQTKPLPDILRSIDKRADTGIDQLAAAILSAEIQGKPEAMSRLDALEKAHPEMRDDAEKVRAIYNAQPLPPGWAAFHAQYGWFADLAASFGKPDTDPARAAVLSAALRTIITLIVSVCLMLMAGTIGLILLLIAIVFYFQGRLRPAFDVQRELPADRNPYLEAFTMYLAGAIAIAGVLHYVFRLSTLWSELALPAGFIVAVLWPRLRGQTWAEWRSTVGLHTGRGFFRECASGALGYLAGLPILGVGLVISAILGALSGVTASHPALRDISITPAGITALLLLGSVWAPITEELMFRGSFFGYLRGRRGWWLSALTVSLLFAAVHPQGWTAIPALASVAMVLAGIREWRGSILGSMTAHAINNTFVLVTLLLMVG